MARIRSVHPGQWTEGDFLECSPLARLLCIALRNSADDRGAFRWKPKTIKAECLPGDNCDIDELLNELVTNRQIIRYQVDGKEYGLIRDFTQWQKPKKPKYIHPVPDEFRTGSEPVENQYETTSEISPLREEGGGRREKERKEDTADAVSSPREIFFESGVIRLTKRDFDKWADAFAKLDLKAELIGLTQWANHQENWFFAVSAALAKRNREAGKQRAGPPARPLTPAGNPWPDGIQ